jgi:membrane protein DedA with SNARE-associated domain
VNEAEAARQARDADVIRVVFVATLAFGAACLLGYFAGWIVREAIPRRALPTIHIVVTRPVPDYVPDSAS